MTQKFNEMMRSAFRQLVLALPASLGLLTVSSQANAACNVALSAPNIKIGSVSSIGLKAADVPGYRFVGIKSQLVSVSCTISQAGFRIAFDGLIPITGQPLILWGSVGAMKVRVMKASVAGISVNMKLDSAASSMYTESVNLTQNDILSLDLSNVPLQNRKSLSLQLQVTGLLPDTYIVRSEATLNSNISVQVVGAQ